MREDRLADLERRLRSLSHSEEAIQEVQTFSSLLAGTKERLDVWNVNNAILKEKIAGKPFGTVMGSNEDCGVEDDSH